MFSFEKSIGIAALSVSLLVIGACTEKEIPLMPENPGNTMEKQQDIAAPNSAVPSKLLSCELVNVKSAEEVLEEANETLASLQNAFMGNTKGRFRFEEIECTSDTLLNVVIRTYQVSYLSKDAAGKDIVLSTIVSIPAFRSGRKITLSNISLSHSMFNMTDTMTKLIANVTKTRCVLFADVVVSPFYQGGGINKRLPGTFVPIAEHNLKARQAIDAELAALELLDSLKCDSDLNFELDPDYHTYNMGISNGGACALAVLKILENDPEYDKINREKIHLGGTLMGEGSPDYGMLYDQCIEEYDTPIQMNFLKPDALVATVNSSYKAHAVFAPKDYFFYEDLGMKKKILLEDFFSPEFCAVRLELEEGSLSFFDAYDNCFWLADVSLSTGITSEIILRGFEKLSDILNPKLFNVDGTLDKNCKEWKALMCALGENSLIDGFAPRTPLLIFSSKGDTFMPYNINEKLYNNLRDGGDNRNVRMRTLYGLDHFPATFYIWGFELTHRNPCISGLF